MKLTSFEAIVHSLGEGGVRYFLPSGFAVNAQADIRPTRHVDRVIALDSENIAGAFKVLAKLGYKPAVPITAAQFADGELRRQWIRDKGMMVLNFFSDRHRETGVDVFVTEPFDFEREAMDARECELSPGVHVKSVSLPALIAMKEAANRPRDLDDVQHLRWIQEEKEPTSDGCDEFDWSVATWEGSRRAQLRHALTFTLRERMEMVEGLADVVRRLQEIRARGGFKTAAKMAGASHSTAALATREPDAPS